jgi:glyoxylase-like metal-dependent hydrolase (beta-lactamase superfamily II)
MTKTKIITIDCEYVEKEIACAYLLIRNDSAIFIETNTNHAVPHLLDALSKEGLSPENVKYIICTHAHLDHSGGAGLLMQSCKNAICLLHPKAAKHLINPEVLIKSSISVYGEENYKNLYGEIIPIPKDRVQIPEDGQTVNWQGTELKFFYTKGHANHHFCIYEKDQNTVFTGDSYGLSYPFLQKKGTFLIPATTPNDFDAVEAIKSIRMIHATGADSAHLTHFGKITLSSATMKDLEEGVQFSENLLTKIESLGANESEIKLGLRESLRAFYDSKAERLGQFFTEEEWKLLELDIRINSEGLWIAYQRRVKKSSQS